MVKNKICSSLTPRVITRSLVLKLSRFHSPSQLYKFKFPAVYAHFYMCARLVWLAIFLTFMFRCAVMKPYPRLWYYRACVVTLYAYRALAHALSLNKNACASITRGSTENLTELESLCCKSLKLQRREFVASNGSKSKDLFSW